MLVQIIPPILAVVLTVTAIYNLLRDQHLREEMEQRNIPVWLRFPAIIMELAVPVIVLLGDAGLAMSVATILVIGSLLLCLLTDWYRRLWLSVPLLILCILWWLNIG